MSRAIRTFLTISALSAAALALPSQAQLRGDWPGDIPGATDGPASAHAEQANTHPSPASLGAPRGDLRRDVAEMSRSLPRHHGN